jgi:hydroxymethylbilane synthase
VRTIRIGSRGSRLALVQAEAVAASIRKLAPGAQVEIQVIKTQGDVITDVPLAQVGGQGFFVKEIERALQRGDVDVAVHSAKDMPTRLAEGLVIGAVSEREDPRDCLVSRAGARLDELPPGAAVGTSSLRRKALLAHERPDIERRELRGNVDTRLRKLDEGQYDAVIIARAALVRLAHADRITEDLAVERFVPAVAQGALAIEARDSDRETLELLARLDHRVTRAEITAERTLLAIVEGGCQLPLGANCRLERGHLALRACLVAPDSSRRIDADAAGPIDRPEELGAEVARMLLERGGRDVLDEVRRT